jgi:hypothetical protein
LDALESENFSNLLKSSDIQTHKKIKCQEKSGAVDFGHKQPKSLEAATAARIEPTNFIQIAKLRVQAIYHAQKTVKREALSLGRMICGSERALLEQTARMQFYWQSGEPSLMSEASEWASANPSALPEIAAGQPNQPSFVNHPTPPNNCSQPSAISAPQ